MSSIVRYLSRIRNISASSDVAFSRKLKYYVQGLWSGGNRWEPHFIVEPVTCIDGTPGRDLVMRMRVDGKFVYRHPTEKEAADAEWQWRIR